MRKIKNIIFDLGGIFIEIDFKKTHNAFVSLGIANFSDFYTQHTASTLFEDLETGKINAQEFYGRFRRETGSLLTDAQIKDAWNALLGTFPLDRLEWLETISKQYNIYLFSNTNSIHYDAFQQIYTNCTGKTNFDDYFIKAYYSHTAGLRKPYPKSFKKVLENENQNPAETLFIDDTPGNIDGAKAAGLQSILLLPPKTVFDIDLSQL
ncbi:MAG TPA: HAD family phosphatase [Segetibacter sp.]